MLPQCYRRPPLPLSNQPCEIFLAVKRHPDPQSPHLIDRAGAAQHPLVGINILGVVRGVIKDRRDHDRRALWPQRRPIVLVNELRMPTLVPVDC